jgi:Fe-S oxidoreductase
MGDEIMLIEQQRETIDACRFCFMCRHVCTMGVVSGWESDTPRGKGLVLFQVLSGHTSFDADLVETIYRCCQCGVCRAWCRGGYKMPETVLLARQDIVSQGQEPAAARQISVNIRNTGNPFGLPPADRFAAFQDPKLFRSEAEVLYYVGCDTAYHQPEIAQSVIKILSRAGVDFALLKDEISSGKPLTVLGYSGQARETAEALSARIRSTRCKILVTACPSSYDAFRNDYDGLLDGIEVLHATEYAARLLREKRIAPKNSFGGRAVTPQDSDYLCRYNGRYDDLRSVLAAIPDADVKTMRWTRELAYSSGEAGGVLRLLHPELAAQLAGRVLNEARQSGAQVLATVCPITKTTLAGAGADGLEIRDVLELLAESL